MQRGWKGGGEVGKFLRGEEEVIFVGRILWW